MKLNQLRYFQAVCRTGSIRKATELLHISQPSVSASIMELEKEFQVQLFRRQSRSLILTEEGRILLGYADDILMKADEAERTMNLLGSSMKTIRIGIPPMIGSLILPELYRKIPGDLHLAVSENGRQELLAKLRARQIEAAFLPHDAAINDESLISTPVFRMETVFCTAGNHPLAGRSSVSFRELGNEQLVLFRNDFFHAEIIRNHLKTAGTDPEILMETSQLSTIHTMIRSGMASGFLFRKLAESYEGIIPISLDPRLEIQISLVRNPDTLHFRQFDRFLQIARNLSIH